MENVLPLLLLGCLAQNCGGGCCGNPGWCFNGDFRNGCFFSRGCDGIMRRCCSRCCTTCCSSRCGCGGWGGCGCGCGCGGFGCGGRGFW